MWLRKGATLILMKPQPSQTHSMILLPMKLTIALFSRQVSDEVGSCSLLICKAHIDAQVSGKYCCNQSRTGPTHHHCHHLPDNSIKGSAFSAQPKGNLSIKAQETLLPARAACQPPCWVREGLPDAYPRKFSTEN